ncbi:GNAT family N-acetyltransferase [Salmonella bongori]|uniref:GNAT family N-acetyltransferase n=1 Tax=Salmonella bongori TaxID=54736 RepID=UPI001287CB3B|nr:GNAT family N-acetyltransferase [Salmonella bongori]ECG8258376.1 GNAT family N-acetyltransferase [Salmonella bongori serovar 48:i:-]ECG9253583.1 GNAT family N-acetyltransferase [Salmonella bongori]EDP8707376.1 GNAT family N-acetyltransferase [Salmonella bongori]EDP8724855.1 GNAT family N-acetyltransferase [Salmonella bongori]EEO9369226.1 GNAT family N-acetyltransferase [Salmonella bongori]
MIHWQDLHHSELTVPQLYALLKLRCVVFVVEQRCPYLDVDGDDLVGDNRHILGWYQDELIAYARILKSDNESDPVVIGRVIVSDAWRGAQVGQQLMTKTLESCRQYWPDKPLYLGAQAHLQHFYARFGFIPVTDIYDEDGIPHRGMAREVHQA